MNDKLPGKQTSSEPGTMVAMSVGCVGMGRNESLVTNIH